jgi:hypothetical protein
MSAGLAVANNWVGIDIERSQEVSNLKVGLTGTTPVDRQEWLAFTANASAESKYTKSVEGHVGPLTIPAPDSVFKQVIDPEDPMPFEADVLNDSTNLTWEVESDHKVHVKLADDTAFMVKVYPVYTVDQSDPGHPFKNYFKEENNWASDLGGVLESAIKVVPIPEGITPTAMEDTAANLQITAVVAATEAVARKCGKLAFNVAASGIKIKMAESVRRTLELSADVFGIDKSAVDDIDIVVDEFPTDPTFASQYEGATEKLNETDGLDVSMPDLDTITCSQSDEVTAGATS